MRPSSYDELSVLVGREFGPGNWATIGSQQVERFAAAMGVGIHRVEPLLLLALLPHLVSEMRLPVPEPKAVVNYGLDSMTAHRMPEPGQPIRARVKLLEIGEAKGGFQLRRQVVVEDDSGNMLLEAVTLSRWLY